MHDRRPTGASGPDLGSKSEYRGRASACWVTLGVAGSLVAVYLLLALGRNALALGASALCASLAVVWAVLFSEPHRAPGSELPARTNIGPPIANLSPDGSGRYLDIDAVEVEAVYVLGAEVFTHLTGGVGSILDPLSGDERHIETSDVSLTWRCQGRRSAAKLAGRLNEWEARGAHLRLMAARGRCALLIEDDDHWVALPELRLSA
jgi:hypothetical protein